MQTMTTIDAAEAILALARIHKGENESAALCYRDAIATLERGRFEDACGRALDSLAHSVGVFHEDHRAARAQLDAVDTTGQEFAKRVGEFMRDGNSQADAIEMTEAERLFIAEGGIFDTSEEG
jgi:hypothetical protein